MAIKFVASHVPAICTIGVGSLVYVLFPGVCKKPCQNGGTCIGGNKCSCPEKYHGQHCLLIKKGWALIYFHYF